MQTKRLGIYLVFWLTTLVVASVYSHAVIASDSSSDNYQVSDTQFGTGLTLESCSGDYCAQASIGDMTSGGSRSSGDSEAGSATFGSIPKDSHPLLEMIIDPGEADLGILSTDKTSTKTMQVRIRSYMSDGYTLHIFGEPPKYQNYHLKSLDDPAASSAGSEQFGINLATNTNPELGADPVQVPSEEVSFGEVLEDYATPNLFKYSSGDAVARSLAETGRTDYTVSMIVNVASSTPAGHFTADYSAVVVPVF